MIFAGIRHWLSVLIGILVMLLFACGRGSGDTAAASQDSTATTAVRITPTEAYDSAECQRLLDLNYDIKLADLESLVTQCESLIEPMLNAVNNIPQQQTEQAQMAQFHAVRSSKPMMYATQLSGYLYLTESLENVPEDLLKRARKQVELATDLQRALGAALSTEANFDAGEDDGH